MELKKEKDQDKNSDRASGKIFLVKFSTIISSIFLTITALGLAYVAGVMSGRHHNSTESGQEIIQPINPEPQIAQGGILAPEELEFARVLKGQTPKRQEPAFQAPAEETPVNEPREDKEVDNIAEEKPQTSPPSIPNEPNGLFDFLYQVAAFRDEASADNLRQKLEGYGYRTILQKNGNLSVILVKMRATENGASEFLDVTRQLRLGNPLLKSRTPVSR